MTKKRKVFLVCTGIGHVHRGFESFATECFEQLKSSSKFDLYLLKGAGSREDHHIVIPCVRRNSGFAEWLNKLSGREKYWLEQFTFLFGMLPSLLRHRPAVIYYSDFVLGTFLWHLRRLLGFKYKLLFSNGAPNGPPFTRMDHIQQLLPMYLKKGSLAGTPDVMQTLLPYAITINREKNSKLIQDKFNLRGQLGLPDNRKIVICVGAVNSHHKRIDYLIREFSYLDPRSYFLVVLGQIDDSSTEILKQAQQTLDSGSFLITQVDGTRVMDFLCVSDYFVLPSLHEGLPRVLPEALSAGLLPIVHDYAVTRETLNNFGVFKDMTKQNILQSSIIEVDTHQISREELMNFAIHHYSWERIASKYEDMIVKNLV